MKCSGDRFPAEKSQHETELVSKWSGSLMQPAQESEYSASLPVNLRAPGSSAGEIAILIVEPALDELLQMVSALAGTPFRVTAAETFAQARALLSSQPPAVLVAAIQLGDFNGLHLVLRGKTVSPALAAIVTSPVPDPVLQADAEAMGATFVVKPYSTRDLVAAIMRTYYKREPGEIIRAPFERRVRERREAAEGFQPERRRAERRRDLTLPENNDLTA